MSSFHHRYSSPILFSIYIYAKTEGVFTHDTKMHDSWSSIQKMAPWLNMVSKCSVRCAATSSNLSLSTLHLSETLHNQLFGNFISSLETSSNCRREINQLCLSNGIFLSSLCFSLYIYKLSLFFFFYSSLPFIFALCLYRSFSTVFPIL